MTMPLQTTELLCLLAAIPVAAVGGAMFLQGVLGIAQWLRLSELLVATTQAAFATSSPEMGDRRETPTNADQPVNAARMWLLLVAGMAALVLGGRLFVTGASGIAQAMGVHPYVIGVTLVAVGSSLPELVTVLVSRLRGHGARSRTPVSAGVVLRGTT